VQGNGAHAPSQHILRYPVGSGR